MQVAPVVLKVVMALEYHLVLHMFLAMARMGSRQGFMSNNKRAAKCYYSDG